MTTILLVENDSDLSMPVAGWLEYENHVVETVKSGEAALEQLKSGKYDIVILNWELPGMSGLDVCKEYRKVGGSAPILLITTKKHTGENQQALEAGANDYLNKPFEIKELSARVKALLRRPQTLSSSDIPSLQSE